MLAYGFKVSTSSSGTETEVTRSLEGGDEVTLEEIGTGGEGDGIADGAFQVGGRGGEEVEGFGDGGGGGVGEEEDEGFDCGDGHSEVRVGGKEGVVG